MLSDSQVLVGLRTELRVRAGETIFDASVRIISMKRQRTQIRLAANAVIDSGREPELLRRALRFARTTGHEPADGR